MFLTAVPKGNDVPWAFYDKVVWVQNYFPDIPVMFGPFSKDKWQHCKPGDILIDDRKSNIAEWQAAGGRPILHEGNIKSTLAALDYI
jgi:5'(3')-deoxyribonucleotidase